MPSANVIVYWGCSCARVGVGVGVLQTTLCRPSPSAHRTHRTSHIAHMEWCNTLLVLCILPL